MLLPIWESSLLKPFQNMFVLALINLFEVCFVHYVNGCCLEGFLEANGRAPLLVLLVVFCQEETF